MIRVRSPSVKHRKEIGIDIRRIIDKREGRSGEKHTKSEERERLYKSKVEKSGNYKISVVKESINDINKENNCLDGVISEKNI